MRHILLSFVFVSAAVLLTAQVVVEPSTAVVSGRSPNITIRGLQSGETVRVHALRTYGRLQSFDGTQVVRDELLHAWVDVRVDGRGIISLDSARPVAGTYSSIDGRGLLWSMRRPEDATLQSARFEGQDRVPTPEATRLVVERNGQVVADELLRFVEAPGLTVEIVPQGDVNGAFAAPRTAKRAPTLILLHGSEGGSNDRSRRMATRWAGLGYAAFALHYFAYDDAKVVEFPGFSGQTLEIRKGR